MYRSCIKRLLDIILSLIFIVILSPLFVVTGLLVFIELGSPIIFKQEREGLHKKTFVIYKFRTMKWNYGAKRKDRMTKVTNFIDRYRFNELAQLFNVLKGDMSLVGPRPFMLPTDFPKERYTVKPGMTGLAQINGGRKISKEQKLEFDLIYNKEVSFLLDLKILILTPVIIFKYR